MSFVQPRDTVFFCIWFFLHDETLLIFGQLVHVVEWWHYPKWWEGGNVQLRHDEIQWMSPIMALWSQSTSSWLQQKLENVYGIWCPEQVNNNACTFMMHQHLGPWQRFIFVLHYLVLILRKAKKIIVGIWQTKILSRWTKRKQQDKGNRCKQFRLHLGNRLVPIQTGHALIES